MISISNERAIEIAEKIGLNLDNFNCVCYATNEEEDDLWGFSSEEQREESIERLNNYWTNVLIELLVG